MAEVEAKGLRARKAWWMMRVHYPFVGDIQKHLDAFQEELIAAGEPPVPIPRNEDKNLFFTEFFGYRGF